MFGGGSHSTVFAFVLAAGSFAALSAAQADRWQTGQGGDGSATVSLLSSNTLSTGNRSIEYHPVLTIGCMAGQPSSWTQSVKIRNGLTGSGSTQVTVRVDGESPQSEAWALGARNRSLSLDGGGGVARLLGARQLRINWSTGFFSGTGEAVFQLAGINEALAQIARICAIDLP
jgi:hypothetical protein